jgi:pyruvate/2-oxoglutarate dehydrogenase complex dihydrolipoamide acyltransferase (E2) component
LFFLFHSDVQKYIESNQLKVKSRIEEKQPTKQPTSDKPQKQISESGGRRYHDIEISSIRRAIAKRLTFSKTNIPHQYISVTSNVDQIIKLRKQMISDPKATVKVSVNDFIIKAVANALRVSFLLFVLRLEYRLFLASTTNEWYL